VTAPKTIVRRSSARRVGAAGRNGRRPTPGVRVALLGSFQLTCDGAPLPVPVTAQRVIAFLALHERPLRRSYVAGMLWLDSSEERALANLRSSLWRLHRLPCPVVETTSRELRLAEEVGVDVRDATDAAQHLLADGDDSESIDCGQLRLITNLLPDWYDDWVLIERERLRQLGLHALERLCERLIEEGRYARALDAALAAVAGEPLRESAHRTLMKLHLAEGNAVEAIRHYRLFRRLLHDQLGLAPSAQMEELVEGMTV
jgi:DNA-binding SARP family transcriptional activator